MRDSEEGACEKKNVSGGLRFFSYSAFFCGSELTFKFAHPSPTLQNVLNRFSVHLPNEERIENVWPYFLAAKPWFKEISDLGYRCTEQNSPDMGQSRKNLMNLANFLGGGVLE